MKRLGSLLIFLLSLSIVLTACGGGGGGGGGGTPPAGTSSVKISGLVGSGGAGGASISKAQTPTENPLSNAIVEIIAYDKSGNKTGSVTTTTLSTGTFTTNLTLSSSGGYLIVSVKKTGFVNYSKRIDFDSPSAVNISAIIDAVLTTIVPLTGDSITISSTGKKVVKIALFKDRRTGRKSVATGRAIALRKQQTGGGPELEIEIPVDPLQAAGVSTLKADLNSFDPITEASRFPGQYMDENGNRIISLGFDFINITDDKGTNLGTLTTQAIKKGKLTKAQASGTYLTRWIGSTSCTTLLTDSCTGGASDDSLCSGLTEAEKAGFNVPVYTYNPYSGLWTMLGIGTLVRDLDGDGEIDDIYVIPDGTTQDYQNQCKTNNGEYLRILVTNEDFIKQWWNLDYPLIFEKPTELCIIKKFVDQNGNPIAGVYVDLYDDDGWSFNYAWGYTGSDGKARLTTILTDGSSDRSATIYYWDPINYEYSSPETVTLGVSPDCPTVPNTITKEAACQVEGHVKDDTGTAIPDQDVYIYSYSPYYYNWAYTDNNGYFIMDARCNTVQDAYVGWDWTPSGRFNPNNNPADYPSSEKKDENYIVTLYDLSRINQAPYVYGWIYAESIFAGDTVGVEVWGWDNECDAPLNWVIKSNGTTLSSGTWDDCWGDSYQEINFPNEGTYPITASVTDSKGKTGTADLGTVYVSGVGENKPPIIYYVDTDNYFPAKNTEIALWGGAYDWDSATLTTKWYANDVEIQGCSDSSANYGYEYWIETTCTYTTPNVNGQLIPITFEVSDGTNTVSWTFDIYVGGVPGGLDIIIQKKGKR